LQALDRGAALVKAGKIATGHNADDVAETVLLNIIRGDVPRCVGGWVGEQAVGWVACRALAVDWWWFGYGHVRAQRMSLLVQ